VSKKDKREARASILAFMLFIILISGFLLMSPCFGGFEGFDLTKPRDQLGGERSHPT
jgi:hypothetical protein